jgi:phospholipid/cholesterol/gamma-HCH transport system permease protein
MKDIVTEKTKQPSALLAITREDQADVFRFSGVLNTQSIHPLYLQLDLYFQKSPSGLLRVEAGRIESCDTAGIALLDWLRQTAIQRQIRIDFCDLKEPWKKLLETADQTATIQPLEVLPAQPLMELGKKTSEIASNFREEIVFVGHLCWAIADTFLHPRKFRLKDFWRTCEQVGANGTLIITLLGVLFGLILAFSSAMPMKQFGVEIYVADLVAYATIRVLGPFITAVILAGRTGSAFAAELGTMKINNEIDAIEVMALDPVRFLVVPRFAATVLMSPLLVVLMNLAGLIGAGLVILSMGYPLVTYWNHVQGILDGTDIAVGLCKSLVFGALVAGIGTLRGLQTGLGPGAVGISTTRAVVSAIIALVVAEGIFSVLLYFIEI